MITINPKYLIGISISSSKNEFGLYTIFTIPTQHFYVPDLSLLTDEVFELAIKACEQQHVDDLNRFKAAFPDIGERIDNAAIEYLLKEKGGL